jgi:hypothetical protein
MILPARLLGSYLEDRSTGQDQELAQQRRHADDLALPRHAARRPVIEIDAARGHLAQHGDGMPDAGGNPHALMGRHHPCSVLGLDEHRAEFGEQQLAAAMRVRAMEVSGRVVVADGYDRSFDAFDLLCADGTGHGPILMDFRPFFKAGRPPIGDARAHEADKQSRALPRLPHDRPFGFRRRRALGSARHRRGAPLVQ